MYLRSNNWTLILSILCPLLMRSQHIAKAVSPIKYDCQFRSSGRPTMYVVWSDKVRASVCVGVKKQLTARDWVGHGWSAKKRWQWLEVAVAGALEPARHASVKWIIMLGVRVCVCIHLVCALPLLGERTASRRIVTLSYYQKYDRDRGQIFVKLNIRNVITYT